MKSESENFEDTENILKSVAESENIKKFKIFSNHNRTQGDGFLSDFFTGEVLNEENGKTIQVAIKKAPLDRPSSGFENKELYNTEVHFYSKIFPVLDKFQKEKNVKQPFNNIPKYLVGSTNSKNVYVAMENLKPEGYVLFDKKKFLDSKHLELIFKTYGKFHALSFVFKQENAEEHQNLVQNITSNWAKLVNFDRVVSSIKNTICNTLKSFDPVTEADILAKLKRLENTKETLNNILPYKGSHDCFIHGDCWSNNMLFKYKESGEIEDVKLIDFQLTDSSSPIFDLSYFFYSGASKEDMDKLDYYLDLYYESLSNFAIELGKNPEEILPLDVLKKEWKHYGVFGIFLGCHLWVIKLMDREDIIEILDQAENLADRIQEKMTSIYKEAEFIERARNICLHAVEYGIV